MHCQWHHSVVAQSWRDDVPAPVQDDIDECFGCILDLVEHLLGKSGEFFPVGATLESSGGSANPFAIGDDDLGERPESSAVLERLYAVAAGQRSSIVAAAFATAVRVADGQDAVRVEVEHVDGPALEILIPYRRSRLRRSVTCRPPWAPGTYKDRGSRASRPRQVLERGPHATRHRKTF